MNEQKELDTYPLILLTMWDKTKSVEIETIPVNISSCEVICKAGDGSCTTVYMPGEDNWWYIKESPEEIAILIDRMNRIHMQRRAEIEQSVEISRDMVETIFDKELPIPSKIEWRAINSGKDVLHITEIAQVKQGFFIRVCDWDTEKDSPKEFSVPVFVRF